MIFRNKYHIGKVSRSKGGKYAGSKSKTKLVNRLVNKLAYFGLMGVGIGTVIGVIVIWVISRNLPDVNSINTYIPAETTKIFSADGVVLAELHEEENRIRIPLEKISSTLTQTVVAIEDTDFYDHHGLNFKGIARAVYRDVIAMSFVEGASTLTQQLARNLFLYKQRKISRKIAEMLLAIQIERNFTKPEILEMYLNQVYWGHNAYGIESASRLYFGKTAIELNLAESSILVGILKGPELYSPYKNMELAKQRQKTVLTRMEKLGLITQEEAQIAYETPLVLAGRKKYRYKAPYFSSYVVQQLISMYGEEATYTSGMRVYTTLNYKLQQHAEDIVKKYIDLTNKPYWINGVKVPSLNVTQAAILAIEPATGYIKTMQGGVDYYEQQYNRTTQAIRQPGSSFKPMVYLTALAKGFSPGTILDDSPITFNTIEGPYSPQNYTKDFSGKIPMRRAFEKSINVIAIKLNDLLGPQNVIKTAQQLGIKSELMPILSLPLGAMEVTMIDLTTVYGVFANNGRRTEPTAILRIEDREGTPLYNHEIREKKVYDDNLIAALVDMMRGIVKYGTGQNANLPRPVAGKTGTTSDYKDAWFIGFVPQLVCSTWMGNDDNSPMNNMTGGWMPAMMWRDFMKVALENVPQQNFVYPRGLYVKKVDWETGKLASEFTPEDMVHEEKYWKNSGPTEYDTQADIDRIKKPTTTEKNESDILNFFEAR